ncbi:WD repeat-containing protein 46-like protein, partial [Dinothrombium tinctorium]
MGSCDGSGITYLSCELLEQYINQGSLLLLIDCRPFLVHNESHIIDAVNIHCPAILRRRTGGRLPLRTVLPDVAVRERLLAGHYYPVILYEDSSSKPDLVDSMAYFVAKCLQQEADTKDIYILEGGFQKFRQLYPRYCTKGMTNACNTGCSRSPGSGSFTWSLKSYNKGCISPRTPKGSNVSIDSNVILSFGNDQGEPVEIMPHLYIGSEYHASCKSVLQKLGITALLNVSHTCPNHFEDCFIYKCIPVEDSGSEDISIWFNDAIDFI